MEPTDAAIRVVVCDAGPLIHLDELDAVDLLADFPRVLVPTIVGGEVERHRPGLLARAPASMTIVAATTNLSGELAAVTRLFALHRGETEALRIALETKADLLLTDDTAARLAAGALSLRVHGTLGLLLRAVRRGLRTADETATLLESLPDRSTLHVGRALLAEVVAQLDRLR